MRIVGDRSRARLLDRLIKDKKNRWASLVVVGVKDDLEAKSLLQWCRNLALTVVWRVAPGAGRQEKQRQEFARDRMRKWAAIYKRFTLVEAATADAPEMLDGQQFDAVALWGLTPAQLAAEGPAWAGLVRDGGALVGLDHRVVDCRRVLNAAVPEWSALRDGVWSVKVRRQAFDAGIKEAGGGRAVDIAHAPDVLARDVDEVGNLLVLEWAGDDSGLRAPTVAHDPVDSRSDADDAVQDVAQPAPKRRGRPPGSKNRAPGVAAARGRKAATP